MQGGEKDASGENHSKMTTKEDAVNLTLLKKEVDALQISVLEQQTPWYKNIPTVLSIVALLLSFSTTLLSYVRTHNQDIQNSRVELRGLLQRLTLLPRENLEAAKKYKGDAETIASIGSFINQENALLARHAAELSRKIPARYVSATEYYAIALALQNAYNVEGARELFTKALDVSSDVNDQVAALRMRANLLFISGQPDVGRTDYRKALRVFDDHRDVYNDYTRKSTHIWTELAWAYSEASIGSKKGAEQHIADAENLLSGLIPSPGVDQLRMQIKQAKAKIFGSHEASIPSGVSPVSGPKPQPVVP